MLMLPDFRVRQRDFLLEISRAITAHLDLTEVLRRVLNASVVMLAGQIGIVALRDASENYAIRAVLGVDSARIPQLNEQLRDLMSTVSANPDFETLNSKLRDMASGLDARLRQSVALPLIFGGEPLGMLVVFRTYVGNALPDDIQVLQSFADQAAIAVHNAQLYERIDQERRRLAAIVQQSADGVMILDRDLRILSFNRALERMTGWRAADAIDRSQDEVIIWKRLEKGDLKGALDSGWPFNQPENSAQQNLYVEGDLERRDGLTLSVGINYAPQFSGDGLLTNIIANVRDITNFRQAQEMQNVFISTVSHELKTPVALIKGYAATLSREDVMWDTAIVREYSTVIEEEADRLTALIENLLTASKIQAERTVHLDIGEVRIDQMAERALERFKVQSPTHTVSLNFPPDFPVVPGDATRLRQVLDNLISNAIKYSPEGGAIEVGGTFDDKAVTIYVRDQGVGLSEQDQERIFDRFYRVDGALSRKTQGTGLGLYLAKSIVEAHGGQMSVDSQPGRGSTFYVSLPL